MWLGGLGGGGGGETCSHITESKAYGYRCPHTVWTSGGRLTATPAAPDLLPLSALLCHRGTTAVGSAPPGAWSTDTYWHHCAVISVKGTPAVAACFLFTGVWTLIYDAGLHRFPLYRLACPSVRHYASTYRREPFACGFN